MGRRFFVSSRNLRRHFGGKSHIAVNFGKRHRAVHRLQPEFRAGASEELIDPAIPLLPVNLHRRLSLRNQHILPQTRQGLVMKELFPAVIGFRAGGEDLDHKLGVLVGVLALVVEIKPAAQP